MIINSNFNVSGVIPNKDEVYSKEWIDDRMDLFMNYTLKSIKNQTNQDFVYLIKYNEQTNMLVMEALKRYKPLPKNVKFVLDYEFRAEIIKDIDKYDMVYITRIDTDDMCHKTYVQQLYNYTPKKDTKVLINQNCYVYDSTENKLIQIKYLCPPLYTLLYTPKEMKWRIHKYVIPAGHIPFFYLNHEILPNNNLIWHIHGKNTLDGSRRLRDGYGLEIDMTKLITNPLKIEKILEEEYIGNS